MKNNTIKVSTSSDSPKTPGGISKSLLTPCRRVGLSRNIRRSGASPFISPLAGNNTTPEPKVIKKEPKKRKLEVTEENIPQTPENCEQKHEDIELVSPQTHIKDNNTTVDRNNLVGTPRNLKLTGKKKSKCLISTFSEETDVIEKNEYPKKDCNEKTESDDMPNSSTLPLSNNRNNKCPSPLKGKTEDLNTDITVIDKVHKLKQKSPSDLTKKCVVVIQKKIFKNDKVKVTKNKDCPDAVNSQILFDSDSDEPLSNLSNNPKTHNNIKDKFQTNNEEPKNKPSNIDNKPKKTKALQQIELNTQSLFDDDDDDFDFERKKTILIKKTYNKVSKPQKAKSTGSITQKDIDDLRSRIEVKKKLLIAKSMTAETEDLRVLIKKWQKGCQDALIELMELMLKKFPDKNMDYGEMLQMLKIPPDLIGYDSENDCFLTPNDTNVVLSSFKLENI